MTEQDREFAAEELRRYFQEADGALGVRSTQAGFEAQMNARSCVMRQQDGGMRVRETRQQSGDGQPFRSMAQVEDFAEIHRRLARLDPKHVRALELSYSCDLDFGGVPMALAVDSDEAKEYFGASIRLCEKLNRDPAISTGRGWLVWLAEQAKLHNKVAHSELLEQIIESTGRRLDSALTAYMETPGHVS